MDKTKRNGRYASEHNKELVRASMIKFRELNPLGEIIQARIIEDTKLSAQIVRKYFKEIQAGK